jgi:hypothetical protein
MEIDWPNGIIEFRVTGSLTAMAIVDGYALLSASPMNRALRGIVWDARAADFKTLDAETMRAALRANPLPTDILQNLRIATVLSEEFWTEAQDLGRDWVEVGKSLDIADRRLFQNLQEARDWVTQNTRDADKTQAAGC